jgi:GR25 family glycosyltransferase involved in LPS biosynthesis
MKLPFSETWLINLVSRPDRYEKMKKQFDYFGWDVKEHITVIHPWCKDIAEYFNISKKGFIGSPNAFSCTREHYTLIKSAYLRGLDSICIIEDDVSFNKNLSIWEDYLNNLPEDWDIIRICSLRGKNEQDVIESKYPNSLWSPVNNGIFGTGCYALNRRGMAYMLKSIEDFMQPIDWPLYYYLPEIKQYLPKVPLGLCLEDSLQGDISPTICKSKLYFNEITNISLDDYHI